jgi:hypothetical protein
MLGLHSRCNICSETLLQNLPTIRPHTLQDRERGKREEVKPLTYKGNWKVYFFGTTAVKHLLLL